MNTIGSPAENTIKALSLTQPWATLVAIGAKKIETRSWQTPYRGRLAMLATGDLEDLFAAVELLRREIVNELYERRPEYVRG